MNIKKLLLVTFALVGILGATFLAYRFYIYQVNKFRPSEGFSHIEHAIDHEQFELTKTLITTENINKNGKFYGDTPLQRAVKIHSLAKDKETNRALIKYLLEKGADTNTKDNGWPILFLAEPALDVELIKLLVEHGANVNASIDFTKLDERFRPEGYKKKTAKLLDILDDYLENQPDLILYHETFLKMIKYLESKGATRAQ